MDWKTLLFSFRGRINRGKYWLVFLVNIIVAMGINVVAALFIGIESAGPGLVLFVVFAAVGVFSLWTSFASSIKRLHDREKSGWWLLIFGVIPAVLVVLAQIIGGPKWVLGLAALAIYVWAFVEIGCLKGTDGPNTYGPDPLPAELS